MLRLNKVTVDGSEVSITEAQSGSGVRVEIRCGPDAPEDVAYVIEKRARHWCNNLIEALPRATARAFRYGPVIYVEALGDNGGVRERLGELTDALTQPLAHGVAAA